MKVTILGKISTITQENDDAAFVPKKFSYRRSFQSYISQFLQVFSMGDVEKYDLFAHKNSKYLSYCFKDYIKAYVNSIHKTKHPRRILDYFGIQKIEQKSKQFLIEKIIHSVEFENPYNIEIENKTEIIEFIRSIDPLNLQDMDNDIKANGWGIKKKLILIMLKILWQYFKLFIN